MNAYTALAELPRAIPAAPIALPSWCAHKDRRELIDAIVLERPTRTRHDACGFQVVQYNGTNATALREMFTAALSDMIAWVSEARADVLPGRPQPALYQQRDEAVRSWANEFSADAVIARALGDA